MRVITECIKRNPASPIFLILLMICTIIVPVSADSPLGDALDNNDLAWTCAGDLGWTIDTELFIRGNSSAKSGSFSYDSWDMGSSELKTIVKGPGKISFDWNVSCDEMNDELSFYIDKNKQKGICGLEETWSSETFDVPAGEHTLMWEYYKMSWNGDESDGLSTGWVDNVSYIQGIATEFSADKVCGESPLTVRFTDESTGDITSREWDFGDGDKSPDQNPEHTYNNPGKYTVSLTVTRNGESETVTKTDYIDVMKGIELKDAVDAHGLEWKTGGNSLWSYEISDIYVNNSCARSGGVLKSGEISWISTSVTGPGTATFDWNAEPGTVMGMPMGQLEFSIDNADQYETDKYKKIRFKGWHHETFNIPNGVHELNWTYSTKTSDKETNGGWLDNVTFNFGGGEPVADFETNVTENRGFAPLSVEFEDTSNGFPTTWDWDFGDLSEHSNKENPVHIYEKPGTYTVKLSITNIAEKDESGNLVTGQATVSKTVTVLEPIPLKDAVDAPDVEWTTGGDAEWFTDLYVSGKGETSARNGLISSADEESWIQGTMTGPGVLTFDWNINSTSYTYDGQLEFLLNNVSQKSIKGKQNWEDWHTEYYEIPPGENTVRWIYTNDYVFEEGHCGHIDNVTFTFGAINPVADFISNATRAMAPASIRFNDTSSGCPTAWNWNFGDSPTLYNNQNMMHNFEKPGTYTTTLAVTNDAGEDHISKEIVILPFMNISDAADTTDTSIEWTTGGISPFDVDIDTYVCNNASVKSGETAASQESWIKTSVTGPGILDFSWMASSEPNSDYLIFLIDGEETDKISGTTEEWEHKSVAIDFEEHELMWKYKKDSGRDMGRDSGWIDNVTYVKTQKTDLKADTVFGQVPLQVNFTGYSTGNVSLWAWDFGDKESAVGRTQTHTYDKPGTYNVTLIIKKDGTDEVKTKPAFITVTPTFEDALETTEHTWVTGGNSDWFVETNDNYVNQSCAKSGELKKRYEKSWIETTVTGPKKVTFAWNVSSKSGYSMSSSDRLTFSIDGETKKEIAGTDNSWKDEEFEIESGKHTLRWTYQKNAYSTSGEDCGWIDNIRIADVAPEVYYFTEKPLTAAGAENKLTIIADHLPQGISDYELTILLSDSDKAEITGFSLPDDIVTVSSEGIPGASAIIKAKDTKSILEAGCENVILAELTIKGLSSGSTDVSISKSIIHDDSGKETEIIQNPKSLEIISVSPFEGFLRIPSDPDADGLYEDLNGDGILNTDDISIYFTNIGDFTKQETKSVFDYNGNGRTDFDDIVVMYRDC
ncbi:PKD domain-containing protein [Methanochimaera problematica]|nr:PKD domain-containing protein [Methanoplanus sp. FWC-SCC4]